LRQLGFPLLFYVKYVDDIAMTVSSTAVNEVLNTFNNFHPRLQFTSEIGGKKLNFLDISIINNNNVIEFKRYHKPTFSRRYLNFLSQHLLSQKRGTVMEIMDRIFFLSHPRFHLENLKYIIIFFLEMTILSNLFLTPSTHTATVFDFAL